MLRKSDNNNDAKVEVIKTIAMSDSFIVITKDEVVISLTQKEMKAIFDNALITFEELFERAIEENEKSNKKTKKSEKEPADMFDDFMEYIRGHKK